MPERNFFKGLKIPGWHRKDQIQPHTANNTSEEGITGLHAKTALTTEVQSVISRMRADIDRPSVGKNKNRFSDFFDYNSIINMDLSRSDKGYFTGEGQLLMTLRVPQISVLYMGYRKKETIPAVPEVFFAELKPAKDWSFQNASVTRDEVHVAETFFCEAQGALRGEVPALWTLVEMTAIIMKGLGIKGKREMDRLFADVDSASAPSQDSSIGLKRALFLAYGLGGVASGYLHPHTIQNLVNLLKQENRVIRQAGVKFPDENEQLDREIWNFPIAPSSE